MSVVVRETQSKPSVHVTSTPPTQVVGYVRDERVVLSQVVHYGPAGSDGGVVEAMIQQHVEDPEPHPAYDTDIPSLNLLFENGLI